MQANKSISSIPHVRKKLLHVMDTCLLVGVGIFLFGGLVIFLVDRPPEFDTYNAVASNTRALTSSDIVSTAAQTPASSVAAWRAKYGYIFTVFSNDMITYANAQDYGEEAAELTICQKMVADARTAESFPAIPDISAAAHFQSGLTHFQGAAKVCAAQMQVEVTHRGSVPKWARNSGFDPSVDTPPATYQFGRTSFIMNHETGE